MKIKVNFPRRLESGVGKENGKAMENLEKIVSSSISAQMVSAVNLERSSFNTN